MILKMKLKGNLYAKVADSSVSKFMYKIGREDRIH